MRTRSSNKRTSTDRVTNDEIIPPQKKKKANATVTTDHDIESRNSSKRIEADDVDSNVEDESETDPQNRSKACQSTKKGTNIESRNSSTRLELQRVDSSSEDDDKNESSDEFLDAQEEFIDEHEHPTRRSIRLQLKPPSVNQAHSSNDSNVEINQDIVPTNNDEATLDVTNDSPKQNSEHLINENDSSDEEDNSDTDGNKKFKKIFTENDVLLPRGSNKKPPSEYSYTIHNLNYIRRMVGKKESKEYEACPTELKKGFILKLIESIIPGKTFYKYSEILTEYIPIDESEINFQVSQRLKNIKSDTVYKAKRSNKDVTPSKNNIKFNATEYTSHKNYMSFDQVYKGVKLATNTKKWNMFSMFHGLYQSFSIYLYNYSHRLEDKGLVHQCTKVKMTFPEFSNCILFTHGRLVHSGAESKEEGPLSFNWSHDVRAFSYLTSFETDEKKERSIRTLVQRIKL